MTIKEYQSETKKTAIYPENNAINYLTLGLVSEAGEFAGKIKKVIRDNHGIISDSKKTELGFELGDICWYISQMANELDMDLETILSKNIAKLNDRKERNVLGGSGDNR